MLGKLLPEHSLNKCIDALATHIGSQGTCTKHKFEAYVSVYIDRDILQRVGAMRLISRYRNIDRHKDARASAEAFASGERVDAEQLNRFYETGIKYVARLLHLRKEFEKTADNTYKLAARKTEQPKPQASPGCKWCGRCNQEKPLTQFYRLRNAPDGLQYWCKDCQRCKTPTQLVPPVIGTPKHTTTQGEQVSVGFRRCNECHEVKTIDQFHRDNHRRDGRKGKCAKCTMARRRLFAEQRQQSQTAVVIDVKAEPLFSLTSEPLRSGGGR